MWNNGDFFKDSIAVSQNLVYYSRVRVADVLQLPSKHFVQEGPSSPSYKSFLKLSAEAVNHKLRVLCAIGI